METLHCPLHRLFPLVAVPTHVLEIPSAHVFLCAQFTGRQQFHISESSLGRDCGDQARGLDQQHRFPFDNNQIDECPTGSSTRGPSKGPPSTWSTARGTRSVTRPTSERTTAQRSTTQVTGASAVSCVVAGAYINTRESYCSRPGEPAQHNSSHTHRNVFMLPTGAISS